MNPATRIMWSRRMMKAGWLLAPALNCSVQAVKLPFKVFTDPLGVLISCLVFAIAGAFWHNIRLERVATGEELRLAMMKNSCMSNLIPIYQTFYETKSSTPRPLNYGDIKEVEEKCDTSIANQKLFNDQKAGIRK